MVVILCFIIMTILEIYVYDIVGLWDLLGYLIFFGIKVYVIEENFLIFKYV